MHFFRPSGDFQSLESAVAPPVAQPVPTSPVVPVSTVAPSSLSANIAPSSNVDLLGDLDLSPPSLPLSLPVQPASFAAPPAAARSYVYNMTVPVASRVAVPEAAMTFTTLQPNALTTSALVPGPAPSLESSVCTANVSSDIARLCVPLYLTVCVVRCCPALMRPHYCYNLPQGCEVWAASNCVHISCTQLPIESL